MPAAWLQSYPELELLDLDVARGTTERRERQRLFPLRQVLADSDERALLHMLDLLAAGDQATAATLAVQHSRQLCLQQDIHLLAGALLLAEGRAMEAVDALGQCYRAMQGDDGQPPRLPTGSLIRRVYPGLRLLLRVCPVLLLPLYPEEYAVALMYAVALWHSGRPADALEVLREQVGNAGINDELKLLAGQIYIARGEFEQARNALGAPEQSQRDSVELARCLYLADVLSRQGNHGLAARELHSALLIVKEVNPHLHARARFVLADCCDHLNQPLNALRHSGLVRPDEVPGYVAAAMLAAEQGRVDRLEAMSPVEIERLTRQNEFVPNDDEVVQSTEALKSSRLDTSHDPLAKLRPVEMSWLKRQAEEREITALKEAAARGETITVTTVEALSPAAKLLRARIDAALNWWPARRESLEHAAPRERLARVRALDVGHLRIDFAGAREAPARPLPSERRTEFLFGVLSAAAAITVVLMMLRSCFY